MQCGERERSWVQIKGYLIGLVVGIYGADCFTNVKDLNTHTQTLIVCLFTSLGERGVTRLLMAAVKAWLGMGQPLCDLLQFITEGKT